MNDQRSVRSAVARMNLAEPTRQIRIEAGNKWNSRRTSQPRRTNSCDRYTQHQRERRDNPYDAHFLRHVTYSLHDSLQNVDVVLADGDQQRQRCRNVKDAGYYAAPNDCSGQSMFRILDFVAHYGSKLKPHEAETNHAKGIQQKSRVRGDLKILSAHSSAVAQPNNQPQSHQHCRSDDRSDAAQVVNPLPNSESHNIQNHQNREQSQRSRHRKNFVVSQILMARKNEYRHA